MTNTQCRYCHYFRHPVKVKTITREDGKKIATKLCEFKGERTATNQACEFFELSDYFYCLKNQQPIHVDACINRKATGKEGFESCTRCRQYEKLVEAIEFSEELNQEI